MRIDLTRREVDATIDILTSVTAYTTEELADHFGWGKNEVNAWASALRKIDAAAAAWDAEATR